MVKKSEFYKETMKYLDETFKKNGYTFNFRDTRDLKFVKSLLRVHKPWGFMALLDTYFDRPRENPSVYHMSFQTPYLMDQPLFKGRVRSHEDRLCGPPKVDILKELGFKLKKFG